MVILMTSYGKCIHKDKEKVLISSTGLGNFVI